MAINYKEWQSSQWREWLKMRDEVISQYFDTLRKYVNLPASEHLIMRDLKRRIDPRVLKLTYTAVAPPENSILHNWQEDVPRTLELPDGVDEENINPEEYPELETDVDQVPDDENVYQLLDQLCRFGQIHRELMSEWSSNMSFFMQNGKGAAGAVTALVLVSQSLLCVNVCRDAVCGQENSKASALLSHAKNKVFSFSLLCRQEALRGKQTVRLRQLTDALVCTLDKAMIYLNNLPGKE